MITKFVENGMISILNDGQIQVREDTVVDEDSTEISRTYFRYVLTPSADTTPITDEKVKKVAEVVWTPEVIKAYEDKIAALPKFPSPL